MRTILTRTALATAAVSAALALAACNSGDTAAAPAASSSASAGSSTSAGASPSPGSSTTSNFNDADVTFVQMMIPHHRQAVQMADMILAKDGVSSEVRGLAEQIQAAQEPEIQTMTGWLTAWGRKPMSSMSGMGGMGGMGGMSEDQMKQLEQAKGAAAEKLFLTDMVKHHQSAIDMAKTEINQGQNPDAVALAKSIVESQQKEIDTMNAMLAKR